MKVYDLHRSLFILGEWRTNIHGGKLYSSLEAAQGAMSVHIWTKRSRQRAWDSDCRDMIFERKVEP